MTFRSAFRTTFPSQLAVLALASAFSVSMSAQQSADVNTGSTLSSAPQSSATPPSPSAQEKLSTPPKEGFWGHLNPMARKKWVDRRIEPIRGELNELDEVNAKNAKDIKDVDARATAGISKAQSTADQANQVATTAGQQAQQAGSVAAQANGKVDQIGGTVSGLDKYSEKNTVTIAFRRGTTQLSSDAKKELDDMAANLKGHQGYLLEVEAHSPGAGSVGIQGSDKLAEAVKRYLVTEHEIPVYRMHSVALGNVPAADTGEAKPKPVRTSYVDLRLMENSLAAQDGSTPRSNPSQSGAAQQ